MGHGGKRLGAGRPSQLSDEQRYWIGSFYQKQFNELAIANSKTRASSGNSGFEELATVISQLNDIPVEARRRRFRDRRELGDGNSSIDNHVDEIAFIIDEKFNGSRLLKISPLRPYRVKKELLTEIAEIASERYKTKISVSMVEHCVKEYRSLEAWLKSEEADKLEF